MTDPTILPERGSLPEHNKKERLFRTALDQDDYLKLEIEAMDRGMRPYGLTKTIMTLYVRKQLVPMKELSDELRGQVLTHLTDKQEKAKQAKQAARQ